MIKVTCFSPFQYKLFMAPKIVKQKKFFINFIFIKMQRQGFFFFFLERTSNSTTFTENLKLTSRKKEICPSRDDVFLFP